MTWIKTVSMDEDETYRKAMMEQRKLYPNEYATPVPAVDGGGETGIAASHSLIPQCAVSFLQHVWCADGSRFTAYPQPARNDCHHGVGHQPMHY